MQFLSTFYAAIARYALVAVGIIIYFLVRRGMLYQPKNERTLAVLEIDCTQKRLPVTHYETTIGRSRGCDVVINLPAISRQHAVLTLNDNGYWRVADTKSRGGTLINGQENTDDFDIRIGDVISLAGVNITLMPADTLVKKVRKKGKRSADEYLQDWLAAHPKRAGSGIAPVLWLNLFQLLALVQMHFAVGAEYRAALYIAFLVVMAMPWIWHIIAWMVNIQNRMAETAAFFLTTIGICATASATPDDLIKQTIAFVMGFVLFCALLVVLNNLNLTMFLRKYAGAASFVLLAITLIPGLGVNINGQRNWINLGFITVQPSEFAKILFVFTGAATLQWLLTTKNLLRLSLYAAGCMVLLFLTGDFGTALIFFMAFLVLILMTSGDLRALFLTGAAAGLGAGLVLRYKPYIGRRFATWGRVFSDVYGLGWQQSRTLMAIASGGLFGLGAGMGTLKRVPAADTDLVFGILCEEWGLLMGLLVLGFICLFLRSAMRSGQSTRSSYYTIAACTAGSIFVFQAALNIFGCTDVLPFTGVTLPFISNGGSSIMASWCMLAFFTAALNYTQPAVEAITVPVQGKDTPRTGLFQKG